ncbi:hypothetical protein AB0M00_43920 [Streptomyces chartreusis]|uniref:hypothetical protein n=1 Tax=Streptomyces TaxID=1883 RepID=UPI0034124B12
MCLQCAADPGTEQGYCAECGCLIALYDGKPMCTPEECWCAKQPNVGDWHALADDYPPVSEKDWLATAAEVWPVWDEETGATQDRPQRSA